ncbi:hypothetical protein SKTS_12170 [Sulfurimicrobium lacus]|uniref:Uncharacterized protein n=1 Tax=Sulfurimicrobium lacus TaxID=2715678 RepID=A0A6F8VB04_9PROT|nr:hypothetical protein [Sulfurimicrobium lacus]BCB26331.1 hypothetical protein SKTS_12170 [Sulfurimicrobium lacus]
MRLGSFIFLLLCCVPASYGDELSICYNYGCSAHGTANLRGAQLSRIRMLFTWVQNAAAERDAIAQAIGLFISFAGQQTPTSNDHGGNVSDDGVDGRMDCIDHAHNATLYLSLMEEHGWLRFHKVLEPVKRAPLLVNDHWAAHIVEQETGQEFVVDSWFFDPGHPAAIFTLDEWKSGAEP